MGKEVTYYSFAENDYWFLKANVQENRVSNAMCSSAQNICERYLKEVIQEQAKVLENTDIMKTHSLRKLRKFIEANIPEFECDWTSIILADGYYFSARYLGDDSYFVDEKDVDICWNAVQEAKRATDCYLEKNELEQEEKQEMLDVEMHRETLKRRMKR